MTRRSWYLDFSASTPPADPEVPTKRAFLADFGYGSPLPAAGRLRNTQPAVFRTVHQIGKPDAMSKLS
ncbi:MAG: hypothetical protein P1S46_03865 [bacterium]|nr:hypothetical protein [bacterium]